MVLVPMLRGLARKLVRASLHGIGIGQIGISLEEAVSLFCPFLQNKWVVCSVLLRPYRKVLELRVVAQEVLG